MRFSGVTPTLVLPVKKFSPVAADRADISLWCLCNSIYSGSGTFDLVIMFGPFFIFLLIDYLSNGTINVVYSYMY